MENFIFCVVVNAPKMSKDFLKNKNKKKFANMIDHVCTNFFYKRNVYDDLETNSSISFQYSEGASRR